MGLGVEMNSDLVGKYFIHDGQTWEVNEWHDGVFICTSEDGEEQEFEADVIRNGMEEYEEEQRNKADGI